MWNKLCAIWNFLQKLEILYFSHVLQEERLKSKPFHDLLNWQMRFSTLVLIRHWNNHLVGSNNSLLSSKKHKVRNRNTDWQKYLLEFAGGFVIQVAEFHVNSLNKSIRAYLSNISIFNALSFDIQL